MSYELVKHGEWEPYDKAGMLLQCCDCGLVHDIEFKTKVISGKRKLFIKFIRDDRKTAAGRRKGNFTCVKRK